MNINIYKEFMIKVYTEAYESTEEGSKLRMQG